LVMRNAHVARLRLGSIADRGSGSKRDLLPEPPTP
jgi:hypothetical protein